MTVIKLEAWAFEREYTKRIILGINKALPVLLAELKRLTPEDTKHMLESYVTQNAKLEWGTVVWSIGNTAEYVLQVEYWVWWLVFKYHKPKWVTFYKWVWNRTFARAVDNKREEIINIIYNEINR